MRGAALVDRRPEALDVRLARVIRLPRVHHSLNYYLLTWRNLSDTLLKNLILDVSLMKMERGLWVCECECVRGKGEVVL